MEGFVEEKKIKVIVVDDSLLFREILAIYMGQNSWIDVGGTASTAQEALEKIQKINPEVVTVDLDSIKIDGIKLIKDINKKYKIKIVAISASSQKVVEALNCGAVDCVEKPVVKEAQELRNFSKLLCLTIKDAGTSRKVSMTKKLNSTTRIIADTLKTVDDVIIAIGSSTGGVEALVSIVTKFPVDMPPVLITQHMPEKFTAMFAQRLNSLSKIQVKEACDGDRVKRGEVIIAAGKYHMTLERDKDGYYISSKLGEKVSGHCPSVDVLFSSVANVAKANAIGVILTGMGHDGANGLLEMKKQGAFTIGQDEKSSVVYGMPMVAYNIGAVDIQKPLDEIPKEIIKHLKG